MDSMLFFALRITLLVVLWLFILLALNAQRKDTKAVSQSRQPRAVVPPMPGGSSDMQPAPAKRGGAPRQITIIEGPLMGSRMDLDTLQEITIGRASSCTFVVGDDFASSQHAKLLKRGNDWFVEDLDSRNGTYVNGYRIDQPERVTTESDIKVGRTTIRLVS